MLRILYRLYLYLHVAFAFGDDEEQSFYEQELENTHSSNYRIQDDVEPMDNRPAIKMPSQKSKAG